MNGTDWGWVNDPATFAFAGLITFALSFLTAMMKGWLVPRKTLDLLTTQYNERITETKTQTAERLAEAREAAAEWKKAFDDSDASADAAHAELSKLLNYAEFSAKVIASLPAPPPLREDGAA